MKKNIWFSKIALIALSIMVFSGLNVSKSHAEDLFSAEQKEELNKIIKNYLMENPKTIIEAMELHRFQQKAEEEKKAKEKIADYSEYFTREDAPSLGSADAKITVVEFFDFNCGYCKKALPDIQKIAKENDDVRFVFQEMPILGPTSKTSSNWALAAHKQGKYFEFHAALMKHRGQKDEASLSKISKEIGLDVGKMKSDAADTQTALDIKKSMDAAKAIGINGTPAFIVNNKLYRGYLGENGLEGAIKEARARKDG